MLDCISPEEVCPGLTTRVFGRKDYFYYREIDSTNKRARELANAGYPEGTVVAAEKQNEGRGRRGRSWYSPDSQGIYVSFILRPALPINQISRLSLVNALAVAETLEAELGLSARIKWPNDILINNKKIAGILSEAAIETKGINYVVTGIGLNINNSPEDFPTDFRMAPTSVRAETNSPVCRAGLLQGLLSRLETYYLQLMEGNFADILAKGKKLSQVLGQEVKLDTIDGIVAGQVIDIDDNGFLLVLDNSGRVNTIMSGEIETVPASGPIEK